MALEIISQSFGLNSAGDPLKNPIQAFLDLRGDNLLGKFAAPFSFCFL